MRSFSSKRLSDLAQPCRKSGILVALAHATFVAVAACNFVDTARAQSELNYPAVAITGTEAPGTGGALFSSSWTGNLRYWLNEAGHVAFIGRLNLSSEGVDTTNDQAIWADRGSGLNMISRTGAIAPGGTGTETFSNFDFVQVNNPGQLAFYGDVTGPGVSSINEQWVWSDRNGSGLEVVVRAGDDAPNTDAGVTFSAVGFRMDDTGTMAINGVLQGPGIVDTNDHGWWLESDELGLQLVARNGDSAPLTEEAYFVEEHRPIYGGDWLNNVSPFSATLAGPNIGFLNDHSFWIRNGNSLTLVAREGNQATGLASGVTYSDTLFLYRSNNAGDFVFNARVAGNGISSTNEHGLWSQRGGGPVTLAARGGEAAPETTGDVNFLDFALRGMNEAGQVLFSANLVGADVDSSNSAGLWLDDAGTGFSLVSRLGDPAPNVDDGAVFSEYGVAYLNNAGQAVFHATLAGPEVTAANDTGLWAVDPNGNLTLVVREGDLYDTDDGPGEDWFWVDEIESKVDFNEAGQLLIGLDFSNGSAVRQGIFRLEPVYNPEIFYGGEFLLNGVGPSDSSVTLSGIDVLTGTREDGSPFILTAERPDDLKSVQVFDRTIPPIATTPIVINSLSTLKGLRQGQTLTLVEGGVVDEEFTSVNAHMIISGGSAMERIEAVGTQIDISGGTVQTVEAFAGTAVHITGGNVSDVVGYTGSEITITGGVVEVAVSQGLGSSTHINGGTITTGVGAKDGGAVTIQDGTVHRFSASQGGKVTLSGGEGGSGGASSGGEIVILGGTLSRSSWADPGGVVSISGGEIVTDPAETYGFYANAGSEINLYATEFQLSGMPIPELVNPGDTIVLNDRGGAVLTGTFADGTAFFFYLNDRPVVPRDYFDPRSILTLTLVSSTPLLAGDYSGDGVVDAADYTVWRDTLGATGLAAYELGDGTGDGNVTAEDYDVWKTQFGMTMETAVASASEAVPEPSGMLLLLLAAMASLAIRLPARRLVTCLVLCVLLGSSTQSHAQTLIGGDSIGPDSSSTDFNGGLLAYDIGSNISEPAVEITQDGTTNLDSFRVIVHGIEDSVPNVL